MTVTGKLFYNNKLCLTFLSLLTLIFLIKPCVFKKMLPNSIIDHFIRPDNNITINNNHFFFCLFVQFEYFVIICI